ncbi:MAG: amidohydrolase family protein, partial [Candidatus Ranarchaeia archaeon]
MPILGNASWILTMDAADRVVKDGAILVHEGVITEIGSNESIRQQNPSEEYIDCHSHILMPGLVNGHLHSDQILFRGLGANATLGEWSRQAKWPTLGLATLDELKAGMNLGFLEAVKTGATTCVESQDTRIENQITESSIGFAKLLGFRLAIARPFRPIEDVPPKSSPPFRLHPIKQEISEHERLLKKYGDSPNAMIRIYIGMRFVAPMSDEGLLSPYELTEKYNTKLHFHMAEVEAEQQNTVKTKGMRGVEWLHQKGVLGDKIQLAHGIWLSDNEIRLLKQSGGSVIHCPASNAYLSSGIADIPRYIKEGITVGLGTDGAGSNDTHDMMATLRLATQIAKISHPNQQVITAKDILHLATRGGAQAQSLENKIGSLEVGKQADIIGLGLDKTRAIPVFDPLAAAIYQLDGSDVRFVM